MQCGCYKILNVDYIMAWIESGNFHFRHCNMGPTKVTHAKQIRASRGFNPEWPSELVSSHPTNLPGSAVCIDYSCYGAAFIQKRRCY